MKIDISAAKNRYESTLRAKCADKLTVENVDAQANRDAGAMVRNVLRDGTVNKNLSAAQNLRAVLGIESKADEKKADEKKADEKKTDEKKTDAKSAAVPAAS